MAIEYKEDGSQHVPVMDIDPERQQLIGNDDPEPGDQCVLDPEDQARKPENAVSAVRKKQSADFFASSSYEISTDDSAVS